MFVYGSILFFAYLCSFLGENPPILSFFPGTFLQKEKKMEMLGLEEKTHKAKIKTMSKYRNQQKLVSVCVEVKGRQCG